VGVEGDEGGDECPPPPPDAEEKSRLGSARPVWTTAHDPEATRPVMSRATTTDRRKSFDRRIGSRSPSACDSLSGPPLTERLFRRREARGARETSTPAREWNQAEWAAADCHQLESRNALSLRSPLFESAFAVSHLRVVRPAFGLDRVCFR
jgi:hypothetical protein